MSGALLISWVIVALCVTVAIAFFALARLDPVNRAANWFSAAFVAAAISYGGEIALATGSPPSIARMVIAVSMAAMFILAVQGTARRYKVALPRAWALAAIACSTLWYFLILDMPRGDFLRQMLYQLPYAALSLAGAGVIFRSGARRWFDWLFIGLFAFLAFHFVAKPYLALWTGGVGEDPAHFAQTLYAGISAASSAVLLLILAAAGLSAMIADAALRIIRSAEHDPDTGLLNRSGFTAHAQRRALAIAEAERPREDCEAELSLTLVALDARNLPRGTGLPLANFVTLLWATMPKGALFGRMADDEFAILAPGALFAAREHAEALRQAAADLVIADKPLTLSIGITEREPGDVYADLLARGLWALQEADRAGGNCIRLSARSQFLPS